MVSGAARTVAEARTEKAPKPVCDPQRGVGSGCSKDALALSASRRMDGMGMGLNGERENKVGDRKSKMHGGRDALTKEIVEVRVMMTLRRTTNMNFELWATGRS